MLVFHGSPNNTIDTLRSQFFGGENGSTDGVGINATSNLARANAYASETGSVYVLDISLERFIDIGKAHHLSIEQAQILLDTIATLPEAAQTRLYTDLLGKHTLTFKEEDAALNAYKAHKQAHKDNELGLDRLKPNVEFEVDHVAVMVPRAAGSADALCHINTEHLHYCLALYDNAFASYALAQICEGLHIHRNDQSTLLSFRQEEPILFRVPAAALSAEALKLSSDQLQAIADNCAFFFEHGVNADRAGRAAPLLNALGLPHSERILNSVAQDTDPHAAFVALLQTPPSSPEPTLTVATVETETYQPHRQTRAR
jgi:hypothetical protein